MYLNFWLYLYKRNGPISSGVADFKIDPINTNIYKFFC